MAGFVQDEELLPPDAPDSPGALPRWWDVLAAKRATATPPTVLADAPTPANIPQDTAPIQGVIPESPTSAPGKAPVVAEREQSADALAKIIGQKPKAEQPKWWQRLAAAGVGAAAGYANAEGKLRHPVDASGAIDAIYDVPGQQRRLSDWQTQVGGAQAAADAAKTKEEGWWKNRQLASSEAAQEASTAHTKAQTAAIPGQAVTGAIEHGGEIVPDNPQTSAPREGSTQDIGGKKVFFPSKGQQAKDKKEADQVNWRPLPAAITDGLGLPAGFKVPPAEVDSYVRIFEKKSTDPALKFESHVDENTGSVTTVGRDVRTGEVKFQDTIKGIAAKRPQVTQITIPGLGGETSKSTVTGQDFLDSLNKTAPGTAAQVKAIAEGRAALPPISSRGSGALLRDAVFKYDPDFSEQRGQLRRAFTTGPDGRNIGALNTATVHLDQLYEAAAAMKNGTFQPGNQLYNYIATKFGASAPTNHKFVMNALAGEAASALKGNATDPEIAHVLSSLNADMSPEQATGVAKTGLHVFGAKLNTYQERYRQQIPNDTVWSPVLPSAAQVFSKHGVSATEGPPAGEAKTVTVQIPGHPPGQIPASALAQFKLDHPNAVVK